jgi:hypothetical protein
LLDERCLQFQAGAVLNESEPAHINEARLTSAGPDLEHLRTGRGLGSNLNHVATGSSISLNHIRTGIRFSINFSSNRALITAWIRRVHCRYDRSIRVRF